MFFILRLTAKPKMVATWVLLRHNLSPLVKQSNKIASTSVAIISLASWVKILFRVRQSQRPTLRQNQWALLALQNRLVIQEKKCYNNSHGGISSDG